MADVSALNRSRIQEIIRLALDPDMVFPSYIEKVFGAQSFEYPVGSALVKAECLVPLAFVFDEIGKRWLSMQCEKKMSLREIAKQYGCHHTGVSRRIQSVLDRAVDKVDDRVAWFIVDVYFTHFGKTRPEDLNIDPPVKGVAQVAHTEKLTNTRKSVYLHLS